MKNGSIDVMEDPMAALMELDQWYGWSRRIEILRELVEPRRTFPWLVIFVFFLIMVGMGLLGVSAYLLFFY